MIGRNAQNLRKINAIIIPGSVGPLLAKAAATWIIRAAQSFAASPGDGPASPAIRATPPRKMHVFCRAKEICGAGSLIESYGRYGSLLVGGCLPMTAIGILPVASDSLSDGRSRILVGDAANATETLPSLPVKVDLIHFFSTL